MKGSLSVFPGSGGGGDELEKNLADLEQLGLTANAEKTEVGDELL